MSITAIADDDQPEDWRQRVFEDSPATYERYRVTRPGYHSYRDVSAANARIRACLTQLKNGGYDLGRSRDFGRGVAFAVSLVEVALDGKD